MSSSHRYGAGIIACLLLPSCALDTIRLDRATALGEAGRAATTRTRTVLADVRTVNRDVLIELAAMDSNCGLPNPVVRTGPRQPAEMLCVRGAPKPALVMRHWRQRDFAPSLAVIDGISAYLGAVDAIIGRKPADLAGEAAEAEATLRTIGDSVAAIAGTPALPVPSADQTDAISKSLALLGEIMDEAGRVDDLRTLETARDQRRFLETLTALDRICKEAVANLKGQLLNQRTVLAFQLKAIPDTDVPARRAVATRLMATIDQYEATPELAAALRQAIRAFGISHAEYHDLLFNDQAQLTRAERRRRAHIAQARVLGALGGLAAIIKAF